MNGFVFSIPSLLGIFVVLYSIFSIVLVCLRKMWHFWCRKSLERDYMKRLRAGKDVEVLNHDHEKILGIPIVEFLHRKSIKRNVKYYSYNEKISFVNPVLKLVDGKVTLVGGVLRKQNKPKRRISVETYLHYYDPPKLPTYRFNREQGKYILVPEKTSTKKQA